MRAIFLFGAAYVATVLPSAACASDDPSIVYDCDTTADHFSDLSLPASGSFVVTGKLRPMSVAKSRNFVPLTRISISEASDGSGPPNSGWAGFELMLGPGEGKPRGPALLNFSQRVAGGENQTELAGLPSSDEIAFSLSYDGSSVIAKVDGHEKKLAFKAARPAVKIVCSSGEFLYRELTITPTR